MKFLIAGANGYGNAGDDICAISCKKIIKSVYINAEIKITQPPFNKELADWADVIVLGGGGIIYDANFANLENYLEYMEYGQKNKKITVALGVGEQGIVTSKGKGRYADILSKTSLITVRSGLDKKRLDEIGVKNVKATQDLAFSYDFNIYKAKAKLNRFTNRFSSDKRPRLGIVISNQEHMVNDLKLAFSKDEKKNALHFRNSIESMMNQVTKNFQVTLITQSRDDLKIVESYLKKYKVKSCIYRNEEDLKMLLSSYARQDLVLTQRFHGVIFSLMLGVPVVALGYHGQKQYKLFKDLGIENKLIMYHQPKVIEEFLNDLKENNLISINKYRIIADRLMLKNIRESAKENKTSLFFCLKD